MISITASPSTVTQKNTVLTANISGQQPGQPIYTWSILASPPNAPTTFSANGTATANTTTVTFSRAGSYLFLLTVTDNSNPFGTATVEVNVTQTYTLVGISPGSVTVALPNHVGFIATAFDQFLHALFVQPSFTWSITAGGGLVFSSAPSSGFYTPPGVAGSATVQAASGGKTKTASVTITMGNYPTVATGAAASPSTVTGLTTDLTVLGSSSSGESNLTYAWTGATGFSDNGTNTAKSTTAIFSQAGPYTLICTIADKNGLSVTSSVNVTVNQTQTYISVVPSPVILSGGSNQQFTATALDQFYNPMSSQPSFVWSVPQGGGSVNSGGLYTAPSTSGTAIVEADYSGQSGTAQVTISSVRGITFDSGTGILTLVANDFNNNIQISTFTPSSGPTLLLTSMTLTNSSNQTTFSQSDQRDVTTVNSIDYHGETGVNSSFQNISPVPCTARGGSGTNNLQGGTGNDTLYAGSPASSNNTIHGNAGDDTIYGGLGTNYLYGGPGNNTIITNPNAQANYVFPNG